MCITQCTASYRAISAALCEKHFPFQSHLSIMLSPLLMRVCLAVFKIKREILQPLKSDATPFLFTYREGSHIHWLFLWFVCHFLQCFWVKRHHRWRGKQVTQRFSLFDAAQYESEQYQLKMYKMLQFWSLIEQSLLDCQVWKHPFLPEDWIALWWIDLCWF